MTNAGPGEDKIDNRDTVEDAAGRFLAAGLSLGDIWWADAPDEFLDELTDQGPVRNSNVLLVADPGEVEERAGCYLYPDRKKWPEWLKAASPADQKAAMEWSRNHKLAAKRGAGIGEFKAWDHDETFGAAPQRQGSYQAALALHDAKLSGPLLPLLKLVALEDVSQWPKVRRYLAVRGYHPHACDVAAMKLLFPPRGKNQPVRKVHISRDQFWALNVDREAMVAGIGAPAFRADVRAALAVLTKWLRVASWRFMKAHGYAPRTHDKSQFIPNVRRPKLARPQFEGGIDWRTMPAGHKKFRRKDQQINKGRVGTGLPAPCREWRGELAVAYRAKHPALPRLTWRSFDDDTIARTTTGADYWERGAQHQAATELAERLLVERDALDRIADAREAQREPDAQIPREAVY